MTESLEVSQLGPRVGSDRCTPKGKRAWLRPKKEACSSDAPEAGTPNEGNSRPHERDERGH
jgi:hypothetical protein